VASRSLLQLGAREIDQLLGRDLSSSRNLANSAGALPTGVKPFERRNWSAKAGVFTIAENSALSLSTTAAGVPFGANMPNQVT
jgi:hypothetical protein